MYRFKIYLEVEIHQTKASKKIGITQPYLSDILSGKRTCKKTTAYCITKYLNSEAEIEDYFDRVD